MDVRGRRITVFGMKDSGLAVAELLRRHGALVRASDVKPRAELPDFDFPFVPQSPEALEDCDVAVLSPGVPADLPIFEQAAARGVLVVGDVEAASWFLQGPILGITGTNGKTTTTALAGHLLQTAGIACQVGGNIGRPVAAMVEASRRDQWNVLELSSFQLETTRTLRVRIAAVLNITQNHLDRHHTFERYAAAKARILACQQPEDFAVLNAENEASAALAAQARGQVRWFRTAGPKRPGFWMEEGWLLADGEPFMPASEIPLRGRHNVENVLAAACCAHLAGAPLEALRRGVRSFRGVEHRIEFVRELNGVAFYNDSKATSVDATRRALESFDTPLWVILGGKDKGSDYRELRPLLASRARAVLLIGAAAPIIASHLEGAVRLIPCGDLRTAVETAWREARPGDTVLLAPACASFDQFSSYEERGRFFKTIVHSLEPRP
ncbi:MAG: UDP-N-acetylmuramoyl-L-alanine--D-glutamate ligase [Bryobacteraceae bacterium]|nr:UDP-N-acetylmuramoyl-L-alanine--D-glutamate ligase [Bryobacteraceae bacterium]